MAAGTWAAMLLSDVLVSQEARFLLPVFPLALALTLGGGGRIVRSGCQVNNSLTFPAIWLGITSGVCQGFHSCCAGPRKPGCVLLERMAADYPTADFLNRSLPRKDKVMVVLLDTKASHRFDYGGLRL
jgi:hypothetical protein